LNENLLRLKAANFPFDSSSNEKFNFTGKFIWDLKTKLFKKQRRLEIKEEKLRGVLKVKKKKLKLNKKEIKQLEKNKEENAETNKFYTNKRRFYNSEFAHKLSEKEALEKILEIDAGKSLEDNRLKEFLDEESNRFKTQGRSVPHYVKSFYPEFIERKLNSDEIYYELRVFNTSRINPIIRTKACQCMLEHISSRNLKIDSSFQGIDYLISLYEKGKDIDELIKLKKHIEQYPLLLELYNNKIEKILIKL
jgi:hypothetical protein